MTTTKLQNKQSPSNQFREELEKKKLTPEENLDCSEEVLHTLLLSQKAIRQFTVNELLRRVEILKTIPDCQRKHEAIAESQQQFQELLADPSTVDAEVVLRILTEQRTAEQAKKDAPAELPEGPDDEPEVRKCRVCGCTDEDACSTKEGPCSWVERDLCSGCEAGAVGGDGND